MKVLLFIAALAVGLLVGYVLGRSHSTPRPSSAPGIGSATHERPARPSPASAILAEIQSLPAPRSARQFRRFSSLAEQIPPESVAKILPVLAGDPKRGFIAQELLQRYAEIDPIAAMEFAAQWPDLRSRQMVESNTFSAWAAIDVHAAWDWLQKQGAAVNRSEWREAVIRGFAEQDPARALELITDQPETSSAYVEVFSSWATRDPVAAAAAALLVTDGSRRVQAINNVINQWADHDLSSARDWLAALPASPAKWIATGTLVEKLAGVDPAAAQRLLAELPDGDARRTATYALARGWAEREPAAAAEWALTLPDGSTRLRSLGQVVNSWAMRDGPAALAFARTRLSGREQEEALQQAFTQQAHRNPEIVLDVLASLPDPGLRQRLFERNQFNLGSAPPEKMLALIDSMPPGRIQTQGRDRFAEHWSAQDPEAAIRWMESLQNPATARSVVPAIFTGLAGSDGPRAGRLAMAVEDSDLRSGAVRAVVNRWSLRDPEGAATWAISLPAGPERHIAITRTFERLAEESPQSAQALIAAQPPGPTREAATLAVATTIAETDPLPASRLALGISDPGIRSRAIGKVFGRWRQFDHEAAERWLRLESHLPPTDIQALLEKPGSD